MIKGTVGIFLHLPSSTNLLWTKLVIWSCISELHWWFSHTELDMESVQVGRFKSYLRHFNSPICITIVLHINYWFMNIFILFQFCLYVCTILPWVINQSMLNSSISSTTFSSHLNSCRIMILCFIKLNKGHLYPDSG